MSSPMDLESLPSPRDKAMRSSVGGWGGSSGRAWQMTPSKYAGYSLRIALSSGTRVRSRRLFRSALISSNDRNSRTRDRN